MAEFPYTQVTGKIKSFFEKIQQIGKPINVDKKWLASIGFNGSNDTTIIPVLKFIDFVDSSGKPTERWNSYRDRIKAGKVLAEGIQKGYCELFSVYPDAYRQSDSNLKSFFSTRTSAGEQAIAKTLATLKALISLANFEDLPVENSPQKSPEKESDIIDIKKGKVNIDDSAAGFVININIQLTLPATSDENVYDNLFKSLKKNLLS